MSRSFALAATLATCALSTVAANGAPRLRPVTPPIARSTPLPASAFAHSAFGQIARLSPSGFLLRLRSGRLLRVDATDAFASGRTSAPLYVGKLVVVTGTIDARGAFIAEAVTRMTSIDRTTRADR